MKFKLSCISSNSRHTVFTVFDSRGANCGQLTVLTDDVILFVSRNWAGDVSWNDHTEWDNATPAKFTGRAVPNPSEEVPEGKRP